MYLNSKCSITECPVANSPGFCTCEKAEHCTLEKAYSNGNVLFQLKSRLKKAGVAVPSDSVPLRETSGNDKEVIMESAPGGLPVEVPDCNGKPEVGNVKLCTYFGCWQTHNEQLIMRPCRIILSQATFFGSEAVLAVHVSLNYLAYLMITEL
jgi:hypothetical protein